MTKIRASFLIVVFEILPICGNAFDWSKCQRFANKDINGGGYIISSSQFTTSTGDCAMIGDVVHSRRVFVAYNLDKIQIDAARGAGEYLSVMASLYSCKNNDQESFSNLMQENYRQIFSPLNSAERSLEKIDEVLISSKSKIGTCKV